MKIVPFRPCRNSIKREALAAHGPVDWKAIDRATRSEFAERHHWPGSAKLAHLLALIGKGE